MRDQNNPLNQLIGVRPSVTETVQRSVHTEVTIPERQAMLAIKLRFGGYLASVIMVAIGLGSVYLLMFTSGYWEGVAGVSGIIVLVLMGCGWMASARPTQLLLQRMEREISDPNRDSELSELLTALQTSQRPPQVVREPVPVRVNGDMTMPDAAAPDQRAAPLSPRFADLMSFVEYAQARGLARSDWLPAGGPRVRLPSGTVVTRSVYDDHIQQLMQWELIEQTTAGYRWLIDPERAVARLHLAAELAK